MDPFVRMKTPRTAVADRTLPRYSAKEETANTVTHAIGCVFALTALVLCTVFASLRREAPVIVTGVLYGVSMLAVYAVSSVYHGLDPNRAGFGKRVMQVVDHCAIYGLIIGSYAPIALTGLRTHDPVKAWATFGVVCAASAAGLVFTAIDFSKFGLISYGAYFIAGWSVLSAVKDIQAVFSTGLIVLLITGGVIYTAGMIPFVLEMRHKRYGHALFHIFILLGSVVQFAGIFKYCIL
ncbi:MAG: hemolysin III family protein [Clostridia bacterium]|nr:hemolysin III family protein [Clostridia bacterium]